MLRKVTVMLFVLLYSMSAVGMPLHYHYCKGQLQHVTLLTKRTCDDTHAKAVSPFACCLGLDKMVCEADEGDCCDDESQWLSNDEDQLQASLTKSIADLDLQIVSPEAGWDLIGSSAETEVEPTANAPPPGGAKYLLYCSFVFYG